MSAQKQLRIGTLLRAATLGVASLVTLAAQPAWSQAFPSKPMRMIVPFAAGGITDVVGRVIAERMAAQLGQPMVVENRAGAGGMIGLDVMLKSEPDGYTIAFLASPTLISGMLNGRIWNPDADFTPLGLNYRQGFLLALNPNMPEFRNVRNITELVRAVKANPGKINFGTIGVGSSGHLVGEMMKNAGGLNWEHVPYKGTAPLLQDVIAGQIPIVLFGAAGDDPAKYPGRIVIIGNSSTRRHPMAPDVSSLTESGFPGIDATTWGGFAGPGRIPGPVAARLTAEYKAAFDRPDTQDKLKFQQLEGMTPAEFGKLIRDTIQLWGRVIKDNNIKAE